MRVADLSLEQLDYWVARARNIEVYTPGEANYLVYVAAPSVPPRKWRPTHFWSQGGPVIEEAKIDLNWDTEGDRLWAASIEPDILAQGRTALEAAMRAYVTAKFGRDLPTT